MFSPIASMLDGIAHGYCLLWNPALLWVHAGADLVIAAAYFAIPFSLIRFIRQRRDIPFNSVFLCFGAFILLCGTTHLLAVYNIWVPNWWLSGGVKIATAGVSVATAGLMVRLMPQALALPSPAQLRVANAELADTNARLEEEVAERKAVQAALARAAETAEALVEQRTAELAAANAQLLRKQARYQAFVQASGDLVWTSHADGTADEVAAANAFLGLPAESTLTHDTWVEQLHPDDRDWVTRGWKRSIETGEPFEAEYRLRNATGGWRTIQSHRVPVRDEGNAVVQEWIGVLSDVTERATAAKQMAAMTEQMQQSQRLEAVGRLAGGIAHDFNNLLTVITGAGGLVLEDLPKDHPVRQDAEDVVAAGTRAAALTAQLLAYSRKQVMQPRVLNLNTVLDDVQAMLRRLIDAPVQIEVNQEADICCIEADVNQLEQVIMNLALNARDAMPNGGTLTFETRRSLMDEQYASTHLGMTPGEYVMLAVSDTGTGMDEMTRKQIFEPFFTTKPLGQGTGLGLATVYGIVRQSGGRIYVYSEPGLGTTFKLYFPRVAAADAIGAAPRMCLPQDLGGRERVLLVEDTDDVRQFVSRVLERAGYAVLVADGPMAALGILEREGRTIDLLLTDVIMPVMNGRELADRVVQVVPEIAILFMSGYTDNAIVHHGVLDPRTSFVHKPFTPDQLLAEVRRALATSAAKRRDAKPGRAALA